MGDFDDGDVPFVGRWCKCGLSAGMSADDVEPGTCPDCGRAWPDEVVQRYEYDGGPEMRENPVVRARATAKFEAAQAARLAREAKEKQDREEAEQDREVGRLLRLTRPMFSDWGGGDSCVLIAGARIEGGRGEVQIAFQGWEVKERRFRGGSLLEALRVAHATGESERKPKKDT